MPKKNQMSLSNDPTSNLKRVNNKLMNYLKTTFEIKDDIILSKNKKCSECKLYLVYILRHEYGASSQEIADLYGITRSEVNRKLKIVRDLVSLNQKIYVNTLNFLIMYYNDHFKPSSS